MGIGVSVEVVIAMPVGTGVRVDVGVLGIVLVGEGSGVSKDSVDVSDARGAVGMTVTIGSTKAAGWVHPNESARNSAINARNRRQSLRK